MIGKSESGLVGSGGLSHLDAMGRAAMVDVGHKPVTSRMARAEGRIEMAGSTLALIVGGDLPKGEVLSVARVAGIQAAKRCSELIPLCHGIPLDSVTLDFEQQIEPPAIWVQSTARCRASTGVEMEALTAASVALLCIYDMAKGVDRGMRIEGLRLLEKTGGRSGDWSVEGAER